MKILSKLKKNKDDRAVAPSSQQDAAEKPLKPRKKGKRNKAEAPARKKFKSPLSNVRIAPRLLLGFLVIAVLSAAMGVFASLSLSQVSAGSEAMYAKILLPTKNAYDMELMIKEQTIYLRQALLADSSMTTAYTSDIQNKRSSIKNAIMMIQSLLKTDAEKTAAVEAFIPIYETYDAKLEEVLGMIEAGNLEAIQEDLTKFGEFRSAEMSVVESMGKLRTTISGDAATLATSNRKQSAQVQLVTIVGISLLVALSVLIGIFTARGISKPVKMLTANVQRLAGGDTDITFNHISSKDEIGQMRDAIRTIVKVVKDLLDDTGMLVDAASEGRLSARADAERHTGAYRRIVEGINTTLDAMMEPINESAQVLGELSRGNLSTGVTGDFKGDFSLVKDALNSTVTTLKGYIGELTYALGEISQGHLSVSIKSEFAGDFAALKESFNESVFAFNQVLSDIDKASEEVAAGTAQLSAGSQVISQGAAEQASALEQLTASLQQISEQTRDNAQNAGAQSDLSQKARENAANGTERMKQLQASMDDIHASSASISKVIKAIDDIAFQTNILALNAAVEAARAGVHGKGFAVVADEVRKLAAKSAEAAQETALLVEGSISKTTAGAKIAKDTAAALADIVSSVEKTASLSAQIASASGEQAVGISQVNKGIEQLSAVVQNNSATAEEAAASSEELSAQAEHLKAMVGRFDLAASGDTKFLTE